MSSTKTTTTTVDTNPEVTGLAAWKKQLITKEDPSHVHKTLGILVLISYIYRLSQCTLRNNDLGFADKPYLTIPTVLLHLALNLSSFEFHIPKQRIKGGYRIWPEYRAHSLVFLCRSLALMTLFWIEREWNLPENHYWNLVIVLATMAAADYASIVYGKDYQSGFARELDVPAIVRYFFSMAQLQATSMCLLGQRRYTMQFLMVIIVQGNAFLMTIRRKNLASHRGLITIYALALLGAGLVAYFEYSRTSFNWFRALAFVGNLATLLRTGPRLIPGLSIVQDNKYVMWILLFTILHQYILPHINDPVIPWQAIAINRTISLSVFALGAYKHFKSKQQKQQPPSVQKPSKAD